MDTILETERLILRPFSASDVNHIFELDTDPEVHKYLGNNPITSKQQAIKTIEHVLEQYDKNGFGRLIVEHKSTGEFIGWSGLKLENTTTNGYKNYIDVGYRLLKKHWGKGYATESALASLDYGFNTKQFKTINAAASCNNLASNHVLKKIGMNLIETFYYDNIKCNWYEIYKLV